MTAPPTRTSGIVEIALKRKFTAKRTHTKKFRDRMCNGSADKISVVLQLKSQIHQHTSVISGWQGQR